MLRSFLAVLFPLLLVASATHAADSVQLQLGAMYAEGIQGVGLYAGLEAQDMLPYASGYLDMALLVSNTYDKQDPVFGGVSVGMRTNVPLAFAPYLGAGVYVGQNEFEVPAGHDGIDNDEDGVKDEPGEMATDNHLIAAVYPEAGWQLKLGNSFSLRLLSRYMVSSVGRQHDDWFYGFSFALATD